MPIYGSTGSGTFSQTLPGFSVTQLTYPSYIDQMMGYLYDNTLNLITAKDLRDVNLTQWYLSQQGTNILGSIKGANMNTTSDQSITFQNGNTFIITDMIITNASTSLTVANDAEVYSSTSRTGNQLVSTVINSLHTLTSSQVFINVANEQVNIGRYTCGNQIYFSLGTPQGTTSTADVYILGIVIN